MDNTENNETLNPETTASEGIPEPSPDYDPKDTTEESAETDHADSQEIVPETKLIEKPEAEEKSTPKYPREKMPASEERTWAMLAHLSILLNLVTGFVGGLAAIVIYFVYKDRSRLVAYHAMQSFIFQAITWIGAGVLAGLFIGLGSAFAILIIPLLCLIPGFLSLLLLPASLIYGIIGAVQVNNGEDFRYWQIGDWVRDILEPKPIPADQAK